MIIDKPITQQGFSRLTNDCNCNNFNCTMNKIEQNSVIDDDRSSAIKAVMKDLSKIKQRLLKTESDVSPLQTLVQEIKDNK